MYLLLQQLAIVTNISFFQTGHQHHLVLGLGTVLVGTENIDRSEVLNGVEVFNDGLFLLIETAPLVKLVSTASPAIADAIGANSVRSPVQTITAA